MASRKEQKAALRAERERRAAEAAAADRRKKTIGYAVGGGLLVAAVVAIVVAVAAGGGGGGGTKDAGAFYPKATIPAPKTGLTLPTAAKAAGCTIITHPAEGHNHTTAPVKYKTNPPSSGDHDPTPSSDGVYMPANTPGIGHLVHALEHGRVILWVKPGAPAAVRGKLKALYDEDPNQVILAPNKTGMPYQVAASAWTGDKDHGGTIPEFGHVIGCSSLSDNAIQALRAFRDQYKSHGPEAYYNHIAE